jgi:hypothetical protein
MGAAVNFYMVNISIPVLVVGVNLGLIFAKVVPFLYIGIVGILMLIGFAIIGYYKLKDIKS